MTKHETRLGDLIIQDLSKSGRAGFGESRSRFINTNQETFGVPLPSIKKLVKKYLSEYELDDSPAALEEEAIYLLGQPIFDSQIAGIQILAFISKEKLFTDLKTIEKAVKYITGWALVDTLATDVVAVILRDNPKEVDLLIDWASSDNNWLRRCSVVSLIKARNYITDWQSYKNLILDQCVSENDLYVKKAIKWLQSTE